MVEKIFFYLIINLILAGSVQSKNYKGAEYRTKEAFLYGRFEARFQPAYREGVVSSFFTYHEITDSTRWNEIDIEFIGRYANNLQFNVITNSYHIRNNYVSFDPYADFHTYGFEWTPEYVAWFIDGEEVYRQTGIHDSILVYPQKIMMNIWNPVFTGWVGYWNDAYLPAYSKYDWISYSSYTPGTGSSGTDNNFSLQWKDELDSYDAGRWDMASHTFAGNQCDFIPENIIFENGIMTLALTSANNTGGVDNSPPQVLWIRENYDKSVTVMFSEEMDQVSAETTANYILPGVTITQAVLSQDKKSVTLLTDGYDLSVDYNLIVMGVKDDAVNPNTLTLSNKIIIKLNPLEFPCAVNVGGEQTGSFLADQEWSENVEYGYWMGDVRNYNNREVSNADNDQIYATERKGLITYKIRVPDGTYNVKLLFAENNSNQIGERTFDIVIEDEVAADDLDIKALAGSNTEYVLEKEVEINDEVIDIYFAGQTDSAFVNAIEIEQLVTSADDQGNSVPLDFNLYQNYPNPFNGVTQISFVLNKPQEISYAIYDVLGSEVFNADLGFIQPGDYHVSWEGVSSAGHSINSGVYFFLLRSKDISRAIKLVYIK